MASANATTLVAVDSCFTSGGPHALAGVETALAGVSGPVTLLSFSQPGPAVDDVQRALESAGADVRVESGAPALDEVAPLVSDRYLELLARVPAEFTINGKSLKQAWAYEGRLSLWWLHELSGRRSDIYPAFTRLCQIEVTKQALARTHATRVVLLSGDGAFAKVMRSLCDAAGVDFYQPKALEAASDALGLGEIVSRLGLWAARVTLMTGMAKALTRNTRPVHDETPVSCFTTIYPAMFGATAGVRDSTLMGVPTMMRERGVNPFIGVTFAVDDGHQHLSLAAYAKACLMLRRQPAFDGVPARLMDRDLSWRHLFGGIATGLRAVIAQYRVERDRGFRKQWVLDGVNIFPLLIPELRMAVYRTPRYLVHLIRTRDFLNRVKPQAVVGAFFEFGIGRAGVYAANTALVPPLTIGVQHGATGRKLMYRLVPGELPETLGLNAPNAPGAPATFDAMPVHMHLLLESDETHRTMARSGYADDQLHVVGAPRLDALADVPRFAARTEPSDRPVQVLVAFGGSDGAQIMALCKAVMERTSAYHFLLKTHPRSSVQAPQIYDQLRGVSGATYEVAIDGFYDLLPRADVVVATYSSAGMEASTLGYPVVALHMPDYASPSGLMDAGGNVRFAASPEGLVAELAAATSTPPAVSADSVFWDLDGQAQMRWADTIARLVKAHASR